MKHIGNILISLLLLQYIPLQAENVDSLIKIMHPLYDYYPGLGVILKSELPKDWKFDVDTFLYRYATLPLSETHEEAEYYYADYITFLNKEEKQIELERIKKAAKKYKSRRLEDEIPLVDATVCYNSNWIEQIEYGWQITKQLEKKGKHIHAIRLKSELFRKSNIGFDDLYYHAFRIAEELIEDLDKVTEDEFVFKRATYGEIGHLYYNFRDYDNAIPLIEKVLTDTSRYFSDASNLRARNTLGVYYYSIGDLERSEYYYRSMLNSRDSVVYRAVFDAIALSNLGHIYVDRGNCIDALKLYQASLPVSIDVQDYNLAVSILIGMGKCYLSLGELENTKQIIDTTFVYIQNEPGNYISRHKYQMLYSLIGKYYLRQGDLENFERYTDSAAMAEKIREKVFSEQLVLKVKQEYFQMEKKIRDEKINSQRKQIYFSLAIIIIVLLALLIIYYMYRRRNAAYRDLVRKNQQWACVNEQTIKAVDTKNEQKQTTGDISKEDKELLRKVRKSILSEQFYKDPELTLNSLAEKLNISRGSLSKAINTTGKNFNQYINEYRIKEAVLILSSSHYQRVYMDELYEQVGFNSRSSFYRVFKQNTGLSPTEFKNNMGKSSK